MEIGDIIVMIWQLLAHETWHRICEWAHIIWQVDIYHTHVWLYRFQIIVQHIENLYNHDTYDSCVCIYMYGVHTKQ